MTIFLPSFHGSIVLPGEDIPAISLEYTSGITSGAFTREVVVPSGLSHSILVLYVTMASTSVYVTGASIPAGALTSGVSKTNICQGAFFYYVDPPSGTYDITVTGTGDTDIKLCGQVWEGVDQSNPIYLAISGSSSTDNEKINILCDNG